MRPATSSQGPRLVRIAVLCARTTVAVETHSWTNGAKGRTFREICSAGHWSLIEVRDKVCSLSCSGGRFNVRAEWECCCCCWPASRGVVSAIISSKFMLLHAHCTNGWHTAKEIILFRFSLSMWTYCKKFMHISCIILWLWRQTYLYMYACRLLPYAEPLRLLIRLCTSQVVSNSCRAEAWAITSLDCGARRCAFEGDKQLRSNCLSLVLCATPFYACETRLNRVWDLGTVFGSSSKNGIAKIFNHRRYKWPNPVTIACANLSAIYMYACPQFLIVAKESDQ